MGEPGGQGEGSGPEEVPSTMRIGDDEVRFREFQPGDEEQIVALHDTAFQGFYPGLKPVDKLDYVRWFVEPHDSHRATIRVADIGGRIASSSGSLNRAIKVGQRTLLTRTGGMGGATHPDVQRKGIFGRAQKWAVEADATSDPPVTASLYRLTAVTQRIQDNPAPSYGRMGVYLRVLRPWRSTGVKGGFIPYHAFRYAGLALWGKLRPAVGPGAAADATVRTFDSFDDRFPAFLESASAAWDLIPMRSVEYLSWRFRDTRAGAFVVRAAEQGDTLLGYAVLHRLEGRGHIMDVLALPDRLDVVRTLIDDAVQHLGVVPT